jgi:hypothetical protein
VAALAATFRDALRDAGRVTRLLAADTVDGLPVHHFPAAVRPLDGRSRLELLLTLRSCLGDLIARPDVTLTGRSRLVHPEFDDAADHDLVHDVVVEQGDLDLEVPPSVALARFGIHASGFGGIDPDPLYAAQTVLLGCYGFDGDPLLLRAHLTAPIHDTDIALPSSDLRDDLEALRQRIWRQYAYVQLVKALETDA